MNLEELKQIVEAVGEREGWDFSRVQDERDPVPWDYLEVVRRYLRPSDEVLDVGTGGGENFLALASSFGSGIGIDSEPAMIQTAQQNQQRLQMHHVTFALMTAETLQFADAQFDVVLNRHSVVDVGEIVRVLKPSGYFIHQSVGHRNTAEIDAAFGWNQTSFGADGWLTVSELAQDFQAADCHIRALMEYDVPYRFLDLASFIFWRKAVPWPEEFVPEKHWQAINRVLETCTTPRGIETNEHRELLIIQRAKGNTPSCQLNPST